MLFHEKEDPEKTILSIQTTRIVFFPVYIMTLALAIGLIYLIRNGYNITIFGWIASAFFLFISLKYTELHRMGHIWRINKDFFVHYSGIINKRIKKLDYLAISDIEVRQSVFQRLFGYGDVVIHQFAEAIILKSIKKPKMVADKIQEAIENKRKQSQQKGGKSTA